MIAYDLRSSILYLRSSLSFIIWRSALILASFLCVARQRRRRFRLLAHRFIRSGLLNVCVVQRRLTGGRFVKTFHCDVIPALFQLRAPEPIMRPGV